MATQLESNPLKLYIKDIFHAAQDIENIYIYNFRGMRFKNITIHGVVTEMIFNDINGLVVDFNLSDATGSIQIHYDMKRSNASVSSDDFNEICNDYYKIKYSDELSKDELSILNYMTDTIHKNVKLSKNFKCGDYVSVVGDIYVDVVTKKRMISAFQCKKTSPEFEVVWLEELFHLYENYYLRKV